MMPALTSCCLPNLHFQISWVWRWATCSAMWLQQGRSLSRRASPVQINDQVSNGTRNNNEVKRKHSSRLIDQLQASELRRGLSKASLHIWKSWGSMKNKRLCNFISWQWAIGTHCLCLILSIALYGEVIKLLQKCEGCSLHRNKATLF